MNPWKKVAISSFVQSGNFEISFQAGFEPGTLRVTVWPLIHYTKFPYEIFFKFFKQNSKKIFTIFLLQSRRLDRTTIGDFFRKDKKQEMFISYDLDRIFPWNFQKWMEKYTIYFFCYNLTHGKVVRQKSELH